MSVESRRFASVKLISWNVGRRKAQSKQIDAITSVGADIVALQEVTPNTFDGLREGLSDSGLGYCASSEVPELLVASRWPLLPCKTVFNVPRPNRDVLSAVIDSPFGEIELHSTHVPSMSVPPKNQLKIDTCKGIFEALATPARRHRILCGDLNVPKSEHADGTVECFFSLSHPGHKAELDLIVGLSRFGLKDTFRELNGYATEGYSWVSTYGNPFRLDHILASESLHAVRCEYVHQPSNAKLSDHSMICATFKPGRRE